MISDIQKILFAYFETHNCLLNISFIHLFQSGSQILVPITQQLVHVWRAETPQRSSSVRSDLNPGPPFLAHFDEH